VDGELWAVHGGGFYNPQKYMVAPKKLPHHLHWFYWESYSTWLTGFALFTVLYLFNARHLPDRQAVLPGRRARPWPRRWASWWCSGWSTTHLPHASNREGGDLIVGVGWRGWWCWRPGRPASCLRAARPSCWWAR
jgi:hypothetical protein